MSTGGGEGKITRGGAVEAPHKWRQVFTGPNAIPPDKLAAGAALSAFLVLLLLFHLWPGTVWDAFLYRYFWGPVEADAGVEPSVPGQNPETGYNPVSTAGYGLLLAGGVFLVYRVLKRFSIEIDPRFIAALVPYILLGSVGRVLEDAGLFDPPLAYLFISPVIYVVLGIFTTAVCLYSFLVPGRCRKRAGLGGGDPPGGTTGEGALGPSGRLNDRLNGRLNDRLNGRLRLKMISPITWLWILVELLPYLLATAVYGLFYFHARDDFAYMFPPSVIIAVTALFCAAHLRLAAYFDTGGPGHLFGYGLFFLTVHSLFYLRWLAGESWAVEGYDGERHLWTIPAIIGLSLLATAVTLGFYRYAVPWLHRHMIPGSGVVPVVSRAFITPMAAMLFAAHYLDAAATFVGIDYYHYREKHVLPEFLIDLTGTAAVMFVLKFAVLSVIIYAMEHQYRKEMLENPRLAGLVRIAVLVLGLAPGTRDMLRNAAGI